MPSTPIAEAWESCVVLTCQSTYRLNSLQCAAQSCYVSFLLLQHAAARMFQTDRLEFVSLEFIY